MRTFFTAVFLAVLALTASAQNWVSIPVHSNSNFSPIMATGPEGDKYVAEDGKVTRRDHAFQTVLWEQSLAYGNSTQPTCLAFHPVLGVVLQLVSRNVGAIASSDPNLWATIPYDGSSIKYHQVGGTNGVGPFNGGGCSVDNQGTIFLGAMGGSNAMGGQTLVKIVPPNLDRPLSVSGAEGMRGPIPAIVASPDGKTLLALNRNSGSSSLVVIQNQKVVPFDGMPSLAVPYNLSHPSFSPDGRKVYFSWGTNKSYGMVTYDVASGTFGTLNTIDTTLYSPLMYPPADFAWADSDPYYLLCGNVVRYDPATWKPQGSLIPNPDGSGSNFYGDGCNLQLLASHKEHASTLKEFADTLAVLQSNQLLIWDVPRMPIISSVVNSASYQAGPITMNEWITLFGRSLALAPAVPDPATQTASHPFPTSINGTSVTLQLPGKDPVLLVSDYVGPNQINVLTPVDLPAGTTATLVATTKFADGTSVSASTEVKTASSSPAPFTDGAGNTWVVHADGTVNTQARPGETVSIYANGLGPVQTGPYGLKWTVATPVVTFNGVSGPVSYSGLQPDFLGLYQINVTVPTINDGVQPLVIGIGQTTGFASRFLINSVGGR